MTAGRKRALDDVKRGEICALITTGCSLETAARYVGCDRTTIRREELRNPEFAAQLRRSTIEAELHPLRTLLQAAATHWRAAAWILERTRPNEYARSASNLVRIETVHDFVERCLQVIAEELSGSADGAAACRRLTAAIENTCGELTIAATASRDPKRLRKVIAGMSTKNEVLVTDHNVAEVENPEINVELVCAAELGAGDLRQNGPTAAK